TDFYRSEYQKRKDKICPFSSLADFNPLQLTKSHKISKSARNPRQDNPDAGCSFNKCQLT
ncbi:hypothetical protein OK641_04245, partial [Streptococcus pneumoniae]|nr:hypothetical protein [Streptococcus pneumoniae]